MEVILLENVAKLGALGEKVVVKSGYGRNYLIPQKKAVPATAINLLDFEARRAELQTAADDKLRDAQGRAAEVAALEVRLYAKAGDEGKLFGSITVRDITEAMQVRGVPVEKSEVRLPNGPLRELGDYEVQIHLHPEVNATLRVTVNAED